MRGPVHVAAAPAGFVQDCRRCGIVLVDNRDAECVPCETGLAMPRFFTTGANVMTAGKPVYGAWTTDEVPTCAQRDA